jgi:hypothetical protein
MSEKQTESQMFQDAFSSNSGGCRRRCACGREHFDICLSNGWSWNEGELEGLKARAKAEPDLYIESDGSVSTTIIDHNEFVMGCPCGYAVKAEKFIRQNAGSIKRYLDAWSKELKAKAEAIRPSE